MRQDMESREARASGQRGVMLHSESLRGGPPDQHVGSTDTDIQPSNSSAGASGNPSTSHAEARAAGVITLGDAIGELVLG